MMRRAPSTLIAVLVCTLTLPSTAASAETGHAVRETPSTGAQAHQPSFNQEELDQMLAPIALYPDALLAQVLTASQYPVQVVQAARWSRANAHIKGGQAVDAVGREDWHVSVKSLVAFPELLAVMDEKLDWTRRLGEAYREQEPHVLETVQALRQRAEAAGNLGPSEAVQLTRQEGALIIAPANPRIVYVPEYDPLVVYGTWWWPAPPVRWGSFATHPAHSHWRPGTSVIIRSGGGISLSVLSGHIDWRHRHPAVRSPHPGHRVTQGPQRDIRDGASRQINPHLGPRDHRGQLRDGASMIINPHAVPERREHRARRDGDGGPGFMPSRGGRPPDGAAPNFRSRPGPPAMAPSRGNSQNPQRGLGYPR